MNITQQQIIHYIESLQCPEHLQPIKYINLSSNIQLNQRLICSNCAKNGLAGYLEIEAAVIQMNQEKLSNSVKIMFQQLFSSVNTIRNKFDAYANPKIYFHNLTQNMEGLTQFQNEANSYYINNIQNLNQQQILLQSKSQITNSIQIFESFQRKISSLSVKHIPQQPILQEVCNLKFDESILLETNLEDTEFYIAKHGQLLIYSQDQNNLQLQQTVQLKAIDINCVVKAHIKSLIFLGLKNGQVEIFEQLTNRNYVSSHLLHAHDYNPSKSHFGVSCIIVNQEDSEIITGGYDFLIKIWIFQNYQWSNKQILTQHKSHINSLSYNLDFTLFGSASQDQKFAFYKSTSENTYLNTFLQQAQQKVNTICFVSSTDFFISFNQERFILLYRIINLLNPNFKIQHLQKIEFNMLNTDIQIKVQPIYYKSLNLLIYQNSAETYFLNKNNQTQQFEIFSIYPQNQDFTFLKGDAVRLYHFGQFAIQTLKKNDQSIVQIVRI
ncbi:unnamed protein product [Paramecium sonneborni]|uniref:WD domain, G-beta repeat protein n=1 Tax=Paramecium sonneborni TaxID=65129 RepID=A0A8S1QUG2_9CILI|nr:unnamed protein product [Paramecium sonneborni]